MGDIFTTDGKNVRNIAARRNRGIGNVEKGGQQLPDF